MNPRILVNATTLTVGGGVQVGVSFVEYACSSKYDDYKYVFAVSESIFNNLRSNIRNDSRIKRIRISPARVIKGHHSRAILKSIEKSFNPDIVYSLGFPSYTRFRVTEIGRYTNPWEIISPPLPWGSLPILEKIRMYLLIQYRLLWARRAEYYETQTEAAKKGTMNRLKISDDHIKVIPNSLNSVFLINDNIMFKPLVTNEIRIFCLAAAHRHKNLGIIPDVAASIRKISPGRKYSFVITIPKDENINKEIQHKSKRLGVEEMIINVGTIPLDKCVEYYQNSSVVFLPTLLEVFSATFLEAMAMLRPIVTSDLECNHSICGEAALYYDSQSASEAAHAIVALVQDNKMWNELVERGKKQLKIFPSPEIKHELVIEWLNNLALSVRISNEKKNGKKKSENIANL